jgi:hypothetical protein
MKAITKVFLNWSEDTYLGRSIVKNEIDQLDKFSWGIVELKGISIIPRVGETVYFPFSGQDYQLELFEELEKHLKKPNSKGMGSLIHSDNDGLYTVADVSYSTHSRGSLPIYYIEILLTT